MRFYMCILFIFACFRVDVIADVKNEKNKSVFKPTREWQIVNKGKYNISQLIKIC